MMKKILPIFAIVFGLTQITKSQVITCVPCNQLGMSINVGSQQTSISIYHSGQYMTHPRNENIFIWEFSDQQGNILHLDTIVDDAFCNFGHNWSLTDTIDVVVSLVNDSAILPSGNSINCIFEDQIYWSTGSSTPWGSWAFIHNNVGVDITDIYEMTTLDSDFNIFPSPTFSHLNLKGPNEEYAVKILNIHGQLFYEMNHIQGQHLLDVSSYPSGLYFVLVTSPKGNLSLRFVKE
jgi:hypothetical protein